MRPILTTLIACGVFATVCLLFANTATPGRHYQRALQSLRRNNAEKLVYELAAIERRPEYESRVCLLRAWLRLQSGQGDEAESASVAWNDLTYAVQDERIRPLALALMGRSLYEVGRFNEAVGYLHEAVQEDPREPEAHRCLGVIFYDLGVNPAALRELDRLAQLEPASGRPHRVMGLIYREQGEFENAVTAYRESLARDPKQPDGDDIRVELGRCLLSLRRFDEAIAAVEECGDVTDAMVLRAESYYALGQVDEAARWAAKALKSDPQDPYALAFSATLATIRGQTREAADFLAKAVQRKPSEYEFRFRLAQAYHRLGEDSLAEEQEEGMEDLRKMRDELAELLRQANSDVSDVKLRYRIARIAERLGMSELASHWLKAARMVEMGASLAN